MSRTLLVIGAGRESVPGIQRARQMGLHVVASDRDPSAPGLKAAHDSLEASTYDVPATIGEAQRYHRSVRPIHGVICIATDVPVTVAAVAEALDLPGISLSSALLSADKLAMKRAFSAAGVPVPWFTQVESVRHLKMLAAAQGFPLVLKPVDSRGARGVLRLTEEVDLQWAYNFSQVFSPSGRLILEKFLPGPQVSTESLVLNGEAHTVGFSDRNYEFLDRYAPHIIENGGELPSSLPENQQQQIHDLVQQATTALHIKDGVVKGDIVVSEGTAYVIEVATRLSGGYFCTHEIPLSTGIDFVERAIRVALGDFIPSSGLKPSQSEAVVQRYLFPPPGRIVALDGRKEASRMPGIAFCDVWARVGDVIATVDSHPARPGVVIATGRSRTEALRRASRALKRIRIETEPVESAGLSQRGGGLR